VSCVALALAVQTLAGRLAVDLEHLGLEHLSCLQVQNAAELASPVLAQSGGV
jgi:hypothetical protein